MFEWRRRRVAGDRRDDQDDFALAGHPKGVLDKQRECLEETFPVAADPGRNAGQHAADEFQAGGVGPRPDSVDQVFQVRDQVKVQFRGAGFGRDWGGRSRDDWPVLARID